MLRAGSFVLQSSRMGALLRRNAMQAWNKSSWRTNLPLGTLMGRSFSASSASNEEVKAPEGSTPSASSFDTTMDHIFEKQQQELVETSVDGGQVIVTEAFNPTWWPSDQMIRLLVEVHDYTGWEYGPTIVAVTFAIRVIMFPIFVRTQRNTSRVAHMQPELQAIQAKMKALGSDLDYQTQLKYGNQIKALFAKYDCNPMRSLLLPVVQIPIFMGMFFGLRNMPNYFPNELATGGMLWFPDLVAPDPLYILPIGSAITFLATIEMGKDQMTASSPEQGQIMINVFRAMSVVMVPAIMSFSAALNCYWLTNNTFTLFQSALFSSKTVRKYLGIWDPPKPVPGLTPKAKTILETIQDTVQGKEMTEDEKIKRHNDQLEQRRRAAALAQASAEGDLSSGRGGGRRRKKRKGGRR